MNFPRVLALLATNLARGRSARQGCVLASGSSCMRQDSRMQLTDDFWYTPTRDLTAPHLLAGSFERAQRSWRPPRMPGLKSLRRSDLKSIFVGNLDFGVTEDQIRALFE